MHHRTPDGRYLMRRRYQWWAVYHVLVRQCGFPEGYHDFARCIAQLFPEGLIVPKYGVYASRTCVNGEWYRSVTNIGRRPSFENDEQRSETHIIGYDGDLYGKFIEVRLQKYKRGEMKFESLDELKAQLEKDKM